MAEPSILSTGKHFPAGTVTFLFTDMESSTKLAREQPDIWATLRERHNAILQTAIESHNGYVFQVIGDAFCAAFHTAQDAMQAAVQAQTDLYRENWGESPVRVRMGLHTGKAEIQQDGQYQGYLAMSRVQRLMSAGHGGQVLISATTQELLMEDLPKGVSLRDLGEHKLKDLVRAEHIYQLVIPTLPVDFPPLKTLDKLPNNLPIQLTSFIGRERELEEIKDLLAKTRLITLMGIGGTGKTRLALQISAEVMDDFDDGVWLVELASLTNPALVPQAVGSTLNLPEQSGRAYLDVLKDYISRRKLLFVLDNCEHLIEACAQLADALLRAAPYLRILATSREALGIVGESNYPVRSLSFPPNDQLIPAVLSQYDAVSLFVDRAVSVQPSFRIKDQNAPAVAQICARLDGIPLAIELAAARVRTMSVDEIAARLDDRFRLLTGGNRTALERHQTLRATVDWSYNLLSEEEKHLFRRLSIFASGWTLHAAEQVCVLQDNDLDVLDVLTRLVDKSLVILDGSRYHMLETTRQYAREKLLDSPENNVLHEQHLDYFLALAEKAEPLLTSAERQTWLKQLKDDYDNLRTALAWSQGTQKGLRLVGALRWFWEYAGMIREGRSWAEQAIQAFAADSSAARAKALWSAGSMAWLQGDYASAHVWLEESERIWRVILANAQTENEARDAKRGLARTLRKLGNVIYNEKNFAAARALKEFSSNLFRDVGKAWDLALDLHILGQTYMQLGEMDLARKAFAECVALFQQENDPWGTGIAFIDLGIMALDENNLTEAEIHFKASLSAILKSPSAWSISHGLSLLGAVAAQKGETNRAAQLFGASEILRERAGLSEHIMYQTIIEEGILTVRKHFDEKEFRKYWDKGRSMHFEQAIAFALVEG